jgi:hypothetical protein
MAESAEEIVYVVDSSSWISVDGNPDANRILLHLDILIQRGRVKCPPEVWNEIRSAYMVGWLKGKRKDIVHNLRQNVDFLKKVGEVTIKYPAMAGARGTRNRADPYVVAYAAYRNETENPILCVVVSDESALIRPNRKIPTACKTFGVEPITLMEMLKREFPEEFK